MTDKAIDSGSRRRYRSRILAGIARYTADDRQALLAFRGAMYGPQSIFADGAYLDWLYDAPRVAPEPPLWLYRKDEPIEGHQGGLPFTLKVGSHHYDALWLLDLMVSPAFRLRGVGIGLTEIAGQAAPVALGLEVSDDARKALLRAGWMDVGSVPLYVKPFDLAAVVRQWGYTAVWQQMAKLGALPLWLPEVIGRMRVARANVRMIEVERFDARVDQIWQHASRWYSVLCRRDHAYLNWRFDSFPCPQRYRRLLLMQDTEPIGYAVLRVGEHRGLRAGYLVDFLCAPRWTSHLVTCCLQFLRQQRVQIAYCLHLNPRAHRAFSLLGFARRDSTWPLLIRASTLPAAALALLRDRRNWFLTAGDSDADRPREGTVFAANPWQPVQA